jgi:hypothetical protein
MHWRAHGKGDALLACDEFGRPPGFGHLWADSPHEHSRRCAPRELADSCPGTTRLPVILPATMSTSWGRGPGPLAATLCPCREPGHRAGLPLPHNRRLACGGCAAAPESGSLSLRGSVTHHGRTLKRGLTRAPVRTTPSERQKTVPRATVSDEAATSSTDYMRSPVTGGISAILKNVSRFRQKAPRADVARPSPADTVDPRTSAAPKIDPRVGRQGRGAGAGQIA